MDRKHLQSAAAEYYSFRGLLSVPAGALFIVAALGNESWGPLKHDWVFVAALLVIGAICLAVDRYYKQHYGRVTPSPRQQLKGALALVLAVAIMIGLSLLLRSRASWSLDLPVNAIAVPFAVLMLVTYALVVGLRLHHVVIWGSLLVVGLLPIWDGGDPSNAGLVLAGVAVMVNGVFDHLQLARSFGPSPARG